jgi:hypothetical protein
MSAPTIEHVGDQLRCLRHDVLYEREERCPGCVADPRPFVADVEDPIPVAPAGAVSSLDLERQVVAELVIVRDAARALGLPAPIAAPVGKRGSKGTNRKPVKPHRVNLSAASKLWDTWLKGMRVLDELVKRREEADIVRHRQRVEAARMRGAGN